MKHILQASLAATLALVVASATGCRKPGGTEARFETVAVNRGKIARLVTASGTLDAIVSVDVGSQVSGKISKLSVDFNSAVTRGQLVAEIDPTVYEAALRQAEGELASAKASLTLKHQNLERKRILAPMKAASQLDLDQATAEVAEAEALVTIREASLASARANLDYCTITAPVDGIVISREVDLGQTVIAALSTPVLFTIAQDLSRMNIAADVSEADIGLVKEGQSVDFTVDAYPEETFHGTVTQVRKSPNIIQNVVTYQTMITVDNPEQKLLPGMTAEAAILVAERADVLKVPNAALRYSPPEGVSFDLTPPKDFGRSQRLVYVPGSTPSTLKPVLVRAGITDGVDTEILEGLGAGAEVVTSTAFFQAPKSGFAPPPRPAQDL